MKFLEKKISKIEFIAILLKKAYDDDIFALASQLAFHIVLSIFPFLIFVMSLIGVSHMNSNDVVNLLKTVFPESVFETIDKIIMEVTTSQSRGILGISIFTTVWTSSSGFRAVIKGVNKANNIVDKRSFIKKVIISFMSTIALALIILFTLIFLVFGRIIGKYIANLFPMGNSISYIWNLLRGGILTFILILVIAAIYKFTPSIRLKWKDVLPGAIISTTGWIIVSVAFSYYINNFNNYSKIYGSLAAIFILMIWTFLTSFIFLAGVEINSVILLKRQGKF